MGSDTIKVRQEREEAEEVEDGEEEKAMGES
jgi:hypothetical protein